MAAGVVFSLFLDNAKSAFDLLLSIGAGTGLIYLLRWFWWRINAWSEVSAMASSFAISLGFFVAGKYGHTVPDTSILLWTVGVTTIVWLAVTFLTAPVPAATLAAFYSKVRPGGPGWRAVRQASGLPPSPDSPAHALVGWVFGLAAIYGALFATGEFIYGRVLPAVIWTVVAVSATTGLFWAGGRLWTSKTPNSG